MNITTIDITNIEQVSVGDEIIVISSNSNDENSIIKIAKNAKPFLMKFWYIPERLKRVVAD